MDQIIRDVLNSAHAKYSLQLNASLYLPRNKGGRGLRKLETTYKKMRIKAALNLFTSPDPRMMCVKMFEEKRMKNNRTSVIKDATKYAKEDFNITLELLDNDFSVHHEIDGNHVSTSDKKKVAMILKVNDSNNLLEEVCSATWQGVILNNRHNDSTLVLDKCFMWLTRWKDCPVEIINDFQSIYLQTVPTSTFKKYRDHPNIPTTCRLCAGGGDGKH